MHGVPNRLQTRADYECVHAEALSGDVDRRVVIRHWEGLLSGRECYLFDRFLEDGEVPDGEAPEYVVLQQPDGRRRQVRRAAAPGAVMDRLGYSEAEVLARIAELREV